MPVEAWMPAWDVRSRHQVQIQADPAAVYAAILGADFSRNPVLQVLMGIRAIPAVLLAPRQAFHIEPVASGQSRLSTETRVRCGDPGTRQRFRLYWRLVRVGSGLIRWALLRQIKSVAEAATP
jgi:hypothetical protein